jgi:hypothetical protein
MVVGQCRSEHDAHIALNEEIKGKDSKEVIPIGIPYFPLVGSEDGIKLLSESESEERRQAMVVHQVCALQVRVRVRVRVKIRVRE